MINYLYDDNVNKYQKLQQQSYLKDCTLKVEEVDKGIVANVDEALLHYPYGVIRQDGTFVSISGMYRQDKERVPDDFKVSVTPIQTEHKTIVYLGPIWIHYGHFLMEICSRLWYALQHNSADLYWAFVPVNNSCAIPSFINDFFELLGISKDKIILIKENTQFDKVIVPEFSAILGKCFTKEYVAIFRHIAAQVPAATGYDKVYFSRQQFKVNVNTFGEEKIEECFRQNGFQIIYPETLDLRTQISIIKGCKVFAALNGSACHNLLFANNNCDIYILNRFDTPNWAQFIVDEIAGKRTSYVDIYFGFLPVSHGGGPFLVGCNANLSKCLKENFGINTNYNNIPNFADEIVVKYLTKWFGVYSIPRELEFIKNAKISDYLIKGRNFFFKIPPLVKTLARVEFFNEGNAENSVEITDFPQGALVTYPQWFKKKNGQGGVVQYQGTEISFKVRIKGDGVLNISLRGEQKDDGKGGFIPLTVEYLNFVISNNKIMPSPVKVTYEKPYLAKIEVKNNQILQVSARWQKIVENTSEPNSKIKECDYIKEMQSKKYDLIFSLGRACPGSMHLRMAGLQKESYPLDWVSVPSGTKCGKYGFNGKIDALCSGFKDFLNEEDCEVHGDDKVHWAVRNLRTGFDFLHDFPIEMSIHEAYPDVKEKYDRRIKRLLQRIENGQNIAIIWVQDVWDPMYRPIDNLDDVLVIEQYNKLCKSFPGKNIDFIMFERVDDIQDKTIKLIKLNEHIYRFRSNHTIEDESIKGYGHNIILSIGKILKMISLTSK